MSRGTERADALFEGTHRKRRNLISPEGVPLEIQVAGAIERFGAFVLDMMLMGLIILVVDIFLGLFMSKVLDADSEVIGTMILFVAFVVRNCYFLHFELTWQGRTPGKKACSLRVINRNGGELTPAAVIARNLTREVEFFLPLTLLFTLSPDGTVWRHLTALGWVMIIATLPLWNSGRLRAGDLIGGTQVIAMPQRVLLADLSLEAAAARAAGTVSLAGAAAPGPRPVTVEDLRPAAHTLQAQAETSVPPGTAGPGEDAFAFSHEQLAKYGAFELQVLEEFLRRPPSSGTQKLLEEVCRKICNKIGWEGGEIPPGRVRRFLTDFYTAERADLERGQLFGRLREDKNAAAKKDKPES